MTVHRIDLLPLPKRHGKTPMAYNGKVIGTSNSPIYAAARWLVANGAAFPDDTVETWRGAMLCMSGKVGELAKRTVAEHDDPGKHGRPTLELVPWRAFPPHAVRPPAAETPSAGITRLEPAFRPNLEAA